MSNTLLKKPALFFPSPQFSSIGPIPQEQILPTGFWISLFEFVQTDWPPDCLMLPAKLNENSTVVEGYGTSIIFTVWHHFDQICFSLTTVTTVHLLYT